MDVKVEVLSNLIKESKNIVFFGGAGVSTESGIPDFRSEDGLYNQKYDYPPEEILSHHFFMNNTEEFYKFYRDKMNPLIYRPNIVHKKLAKWEQEGKLKAVVTQNIDGLHTKAGSKNVLELHGSVMRNYCMKCGRLHTAEFIFYDSKGVPICQKSRCKGIVKPDVVLYEEPLDEVTVGKTVDFISKADLLIVAGTSLTVYPACSFINYFRGKNMVLINNSSTPYDNRADLVINRPLGEVFKEL